MGLLDSIRKLVAGTLWGDVTPALPVPAPLPLDARLQAIAALLDYVAKIEFSVDNSPAPPRRFRIRRQNLLDEWPDDMKDMVFPTIAVEPGDVAIIARGLTNSIDESTVDQFGLGTAVLPLHEHQERIVLHVWATTRFQRAAIVAGLEGALDPDEEMSGVRLVLPNYFGQVARFTLEGNQRVDDPDSARRRRTARLIVRMEVDVCRLVNVEELPPEGATTEIEVVTKGDPTPVTPLDPPVVP